jgi:AraC family transcriptional regulator
MLDVRLKAVERLWFRSDVVAIGSFRCGAAEPMFRNSGPCTHHTFVFPRTSTRIQHEGGVPFLAGPNAVTFYNQEQVYFREAVSAADASDWYVMADDLLEDAVSVFEAKPRAAKRPFRFAAGSVDAPTYAAQRRLFERVVAGRAEVLEAEEEVLALLQRVLALAYRSERPWRQSREAGEWVEAVAERIARHPERNESLRELAARVECSPFHLCREFRRLKGETIVDYRHRLRLASALERLSGGGADLSTLAGELGYSSHSHFTQAFGRYYGVTPSEWRKSVIAGAPERR